VSLTNRALWTIDRNLGRDLDLTEVARACGVTRHHLAHAFRASAGRSVMDYVRARRLSEAALALASGAPDILGLALESGYASHEAFTRAFRARFGAAPAAVRRRGGTEGLDLSPPLVLAEPSGPPLPTPRIEAAGEILVVGQGARVAFDGDPSIPVLWRRFAPHLGEIEGRAQPIPIGIMRDIDDEGRFDYVCAAEVRAFVAMPRGMIRLRIPARRYAVFRHDGHVSTLGATYAAIWEEGLPGHDLTFAPAPIIERHAPTFDTLTGLGGMEVWIPLSEGRDGAAPPPA